MNEFRDAIVIGAGISGLVTAYELQKRGLKVLLLERSSDVGGVMRSEMRDGFLLEWGPNSFLESPEINNLVAELGLSDQFLTADPRAPRYVCFRGKLEPVPTGLLGGITTPLLSPFGKLRLLAEPLISKRSDTSEESIANFVRRRIGKEAHDRLIAPFISGVYAGNTEKLSLQASLPKLAALEENYGSLIIGAIKMARAAKAAKAAAPVQSTVNKSMPGGGKRLCTFQQGLETLPRTLAENLSNALLKACEINAIEIDRNSAEQSVPRYRVQLQRGGEEHCFTTNKLVVSTPAAASARLLGNALPGLAQELEAIEYAPIAIVYLSFRDSDLPRPLHGFGFLVPRTEGKRLLGSVWNSSLFAGRAPQGRSLLTNFIGGALDPAVIERADDELSAIITRELQAILATNAQPQIVGVRKIARAIPQYNLGHRARVQRIEALLSKEPGLYLAGNYLRGVSVPDCVSRAINLASNII